MARTHQGQKAGLTRAVKTGDTIRIRGEIFRTVTEWEEAGEWPDDWSRWQRAFDDTCDADHRGAFDIAEFA